MTSPEETPGCGGAVGSLVAWAAVTVSLIYLMVHLFVFAYVTWRDAR